MNRNEIINQIKAADNSELFAKALKIKEEHYGKKVFVRGLIEFSNYCKNDCYYCGIRCGNKNADRYRLTKEQILECCDMGFNLGLKTFVLQSGEDRYFDDKIADIVYSIKNKYPTCAVTLSIGEKTREQYESYFKAGADRFLLRHETADSEHYRKLHPEYMSLENRKKCLYTLKEIGFQVGAGFMVGSPYQTAQNLADDILFLKEFQPEMIGIGPFIAQKDSPFANMINGTVEQTLKMVALARVAVPKALIPATTALGTIDPKGREKAMQVGANVVMPNLSPLSVRDKYSLYDDKICTGDESAQCIKCLSGRIQRAGFEMDMTRGDNVNFAHLYKG